MHCGLSAQADIIKIIAYTDENFGRGERRRDVQLLVTAFRDLSQDPTGFNR
jgi:toxin ParE1/3/4